MREKASWQSLEKIPYQLNVWYSLMLIPHSEVVSCHTSVLIHCQMSFTQSPVWFRILCGLGPAQLESLNVDLFMLYSYIGAPWVRGTTGKELRPVSPCHHTVAQTNKCQNHIYHPIEIEIGYFPVSHLYTTYDEKKTNEWKVLSLTNQHVVCTFLIIQFMWFRELNDEKKNIDRYPGKKREENNMSL